MNYISTRAVFIRLRKTLVWIDIAPPPEPAVFRIPEEYAIVASAGSGLAVLELLN